MPAPLELISPNQSIRDIFDVDEGGIWPNCLARVNIVTPELEVVADELVFGRDVEEATLVVGLRAERKQLEIEIVLNGVRCEDG